jgi:rhamnose transport system ATP-binding protein
MEEETEVNDQKASSAAPIVELRNATKSYGAVRALRDGNLSLRPGEVRALIGENGAGKSTLVKVLGGVVRRDAGEMLVDGAPVDFHSPHAAPRRRHRGHLPGAHAVPRPQRRGERRHGLPPAERAQAHRPRRHARQVKGLLDRLGVRLDPERPVRGLSIADQQIVEIAKALSLDARVLIMDEPTAALSGPEVERLFTVVRALQEQGAAVLFISHRLEEVLTISDTVTVMRDGAVVHDARTADMTTDEMVRRMVGRDLSALFPKQDAAVGEAVLKVERPRARACSSTSPSRSAPARSWRWPARRRRPQRGGARDLRHRQGRRRPRRGRRQAAPRRPPARRDARRARLRPRGPPPAGARDGPVDRAATCR